MRGIQPPVIGGKNAISRAPAIVASGRTWMWSIAARITRGVLEGVGIFLAALRQPPHQIADRATRSAGGSTVSSALPTRSRTQAKYRTFILILLDEVADTGAEIVPAGIDA